MIIKIDNRETELIKLCKHYVEIIPNYKELQIIVETLALGDVIICGNNKEEKILIERKSLSDLAASIKDGRYEEQSYRLNGSPFHNHNIIYLIEGDIHKMNQYQSNMFQQKIDKSTLYSCIVSLNFLKGFSVLRSFNLDETSMMICNMAYKINKSEKYNKLPYYSNHKILSNNEGENEDGNDNENGNDKSNISSKNYCSVIKKVKKENITPENISEIMLCQIPGISSTTAIAIMKKFNTISNLIIQLKLEPNILKDLSYINEKGLTRKISKTVIENIIKFLYPK
jgi:ERCC4-type nuclease